jgi:glycosyltransferase involved in cell wall biosynthesis
VFSKIFSCPTKFGESLACGLPVVINSGIGDTEEIVRKERIGVVINEFSPRGYKKAAEELKILLSEKDELRYRCRSVAERYFSLDCGIGQYEQIYHSLITK